MRRSLLAALLVLAAAASDAHAAPFPIGNGENPGVAIDDAGTSYAGWQVNPGGEGEQVQFCVVPARARACASTLALAFPGTGFGGSRVSVLLPAPNTVDVIVPRNVGPLEYGSYLARSVDGGRTFAPAVQISGAFAEQAVPGPGGRVATVGGPTSLNVDSVPADGSGAAGGGAQLGGLLGAQGNDIAAQGADVIAAGSDTGTTSAYRLPGGADPNQEASWQPLPAPLGREPELAGGPAGLVAMLESTGAAPESLFVQRLEAAGWSPPVFLFEVTNNGFDLTQTARGRLSATRTDFDLDSGYFLEYGTSTDGGTLWSSIVRIADYGGFNQTDLEMATAAGGRGVAVTADLSLDGTAIRMTRFTPRTAPVKRRRFRSGRVQVRSVCDGGDLSLVVEAARGNRRVAPSAVLRRARFGRARGARRGFRTRFRARYELTRRRASIPVRVAPRRGKARTLRLRVRRCRATA